MRIARHKRKQSILNCSFSDDKIEAMKRKARELSKMIVQRSKPIINQQPAPSDMCTGIEHGSKVEDRSPPQEDNELSQNNDELSTLTNAESASVPSCSKTLADTVISPNSTSKRKHNKGSSRKCKKLKIPYLVKSDVYQEENVDDLASQEQDDYVLEKLFNKSGTYLCLTYFQRPRPNVT